MNDSPSSAVEVGQSWIRCDSEVNSPEFTVLFLKGNFIILLLICNVKKPKILIRLLALPNLSSH